MKQWQGFAMVCLRVGDFLRLYVCLMDTVFHMFKFQRISPFIRSWLFPKSEHSAAAKRTVHYYIMLVTKQNKKKSLRGLSNYLV